MMVSGNVFRTISFVVAAAFASFLPFVVFVASGVWPPAAMPQETFTTNFFAYQAMSGPVQLFIPVGHAQLLLLSYPVSIVNNVLFGTRSLYEQFSSFAALWYLWSGVLLLLALIATLFTTLRWRERSLLLFIPLATPLLVRSENLGLWISYDRAEELAVLMLAVPLLLWLCHDREIRIRHMALCGGIIAFAVGIKVSFGAILLPFALVGFALAPQRRWPWLLAAFCVSFAIVVTAVITGFFLGSAAQWHFFSSEMTNFLGGNGLQQHDGSIVDAFRQFLSPQSWFFSFQIAVVIVAACLLLIALRSRTTQSRLWLGAVTLTALGEGLILAKRLTLSGMVDSCLLVAYIGAISIALLYRMRAARFAVFATCAMTGAVLSAPLFYNFQHGFAVMIANGDKARELAAAVERPQLPIVYYSDGYRQQLVFPEPAMMLAVLLPQSRSDRKSAMEAAFPERLFNQHPADGIYKFAHVAVVPEFLKTSPQHPQAIRVFGRYSDFDSMLASDHCRRFDFEEPQPARYRSSYYYYPVQVTVCRVPAALQHASLNHASRDARYADDSVAPAAGGTATAVHCPPKVTVYKEGSGLYVMPTCDSQDAEVLFVRMIGGGGGGGGAGPASPQSGGNGGTTNFGSVCANGGGGGAGNSGGLAVSGGDGGSNGDGTATLRISGAAGAGGTYMSSGNLVIGFGGPGGSSPFGGGAPFHFGTAGVAASPNSGAGGAGGSYGATGGGAAGSGGAGEYVELSIVAKSGAVYPYAVGGSGAGGAAPRGAPGGAGGSGIIVVEARWH
jgi:hypothetical protein